MAYLYACLFKYSHWCAENKERTDSENLVGQVAAHEMDAFAKLQYILLLNEVINKTGKVKEGKGPPDQMILWQRVAMTGPGVSLILNK